MQAATPPYYTEGHCIKFLVPTSFDLTERVISCGLTTSRVIFCLT